MSDGPFKSPLSKKCWQPVADRAANENFTLAELQEAIPSALAGEFRELPAEFKRLLERTFHDDEADRLIDPRETGELERLRREGAGFPFATIILDCIEDSMEQGQKGATARVKGTAAAFEQCYCEEARSIEEHAQRDQLDKAVSQTIRERLDQATLSGSRLEEIAGALWNPNETPLPRSTPIHKDIADGPPIEGGDDE